MSARALSLFLIWIPIHLQGAAVAAPHWDTFQYSNTVSIRYFRMGNGRQPMLFLHGLASSSDTWSDMLTFLDCDCTFYGIDFKGHGGSSAPRDGAYSLDDNAAIARAFIENLGLANLILVGHSYGGAVAIQTTLNFAGEPGRIQSLILLGTPGTKQHFPLYMTALRHQGPAQFFEKFTPPELSAWIALRKVYYDKHSATPARIAQYANLWRDPEKTRAMRETGSEFLKDGLKEVASEVKNIRVPTLVIAGEKDGVVRPKQQKKLARRIPNARYVPIAACGHVPQEEVPAETAQAIASFLNGLATPSHAATR